MEILLEPRLYVCFASNCVSLHYDFLRFLYSSVKRQIASCMMNTYMYHRL